jgi:hypothetical protein
MLTLAAMFQRHLQLRVIALIVAILVLGFGVLVILNIQRETEAIVDGNRETARLLAASITKSIENGMLEGRPDIIRRLVQELKKELKDVRVLDVYRYNGVEAFSDLETWKSTSTRRWPSGSPRCAGSRVKRSTIRCSPARSRR